MATRRFSADNSEIRFDLPAAADITGAHAFHFMIRRRATAGFQAIFAHHDTNADAKVPCGVEFNGTSLTHYNDSTNNNTEDGFNRSGGTFNSTTDWLYVISSLTASAGVARVARMHVKNLTAATAMTHFDSGSATSLNPYSATGGTIRVGEWRDVDDANMNLALIAAQSQAVNDSEADAFVATLSTANVLANLTNGLYCVEFNQASVGTAPVDLVGNITHTVTSGTTVDAASDPPGWTFSGGAATTSLPPVQPYRQTASVYSR